MSSHLRLPRPGARQIRSFAIGGAWFFILASLGHLVWITGSKLADPQGHLAIFPAAEDGWGLTYDGGFGLVQSLFQMAVVSVAALVSMLPIVKWRRIAHGVLVGWAGVWLLNAIALAGHDAWLNALSQITVLSVITACTVGRAFIGWTPPSRRAAESNDDTLDEIFDPTEAELPPAEPSRRWRDRLTRILTGRLQVVGQILRSTAGSLRATALNTWRRLRPRADERVRVAAGHARAGAAAAIDQAARAGQCLADRVKPGEKPA